MTSLANNVKFECYDEEGFPPCKETQDARKEKYVLGEYINGSLNILYVHVIRNHPAIRKAMDLAFANFLANIDKFHLDLNFTVTIFSLVHCAV